MSAWRDSPEELLFEGEEIQERVDVDGNRVVVTSHRVLAFTPGGDGRRYGEAARPNVAGVETAATGRPRLVSVAVRTGVLGGVFFALGSAFELDGLLTGAGLSRSAAGRVGVGGSVELLRTVSAFVAVLDDALVLLGAVLLLVAAAATAGYARSRERRLVVRVAGGDDLNLPGAAADEGSVADLRAAIRERP